MDQNKIRRTFFTGSQIFIDEKLIKKGKIDVEIRRHEGIGRKTVSTVSLTEEGLYATPQYRNLIGRRVTVVHDYYVLKGIIFSSSVEPRIGPFYPRVSIGLTEVKFGRLTDIEKMS